MINPPPTTQLPPSPVQCRHAEYSMILSADDDSGKPTPQLIHTAIDAVRYAMHADLSEISARMPRPPYYPEVWPGEHYKLLAALVALVQPEIVIEIGTATGISALALKKYLPPASRIVTYDIAPWTSFSETILREEDFADGRLVQRVGDLTQPHFFKAEEDLLRKSTLLFIDAAKDGRCEPVLLNHFRQCVFEKTPLFIFDDIKLWNMLRPWRDIQAPKLDLTSFGHWSGTGLVEWVWPVAPGASR